MSIHLSNTVWKYSRQQKSGALVVLLAIADYANADGIAWPAVPTLARKVRMSKRNVQRWLSSLQRDGELKVLRNEGRRGVNIYKICLPLDNAKRSDADGTGDAGVARPVTRVSSTNAASVIQSINESSIQSTPVVPKGDDINFWINVSFNCFEESVHPVRPRVLRALSIAIPTLNKNHADSLVAFYQEEPLDYKEPPYSSRRHSPERLMLDLPRQLALAVQTCPPRPPPKKPDFTIEDVIRYLKKKYGDDCRFPSSLEELEQPWYGYLRPEVYDAMRARKRRQVDSAETTSS